MKIQVKFSRVYEIDTEDKNNYSFEDITTESSKVIEAKRLAKMDFEMELSEGMLNESDDYFSIDTQIIKD